MDYVALLEKQKQLTLDAQGREPSSSGPFGHPDRIQAVQNAVEDEQGGVDRLAVYNTHPGLPPSQTLPKGAVFVVREPFYKATADGGYTIRVDHPSDLVLLAAGDERVPSALCPRLVELDQSAAGMKAEGNVAYGRKDFVMAVERYSEALLACKEGDETETLRYDLHRNRANANLLLSRFEAALADAVAAVIPDTGARDEATDKLNGKAYYRAGRAAYAFRDFPRAAACFWDVERCSPSGDVDAEREGKRTACRLEEEKTGRYDFAAMSKTVSATRNNRLDHADFTARVEIRDAGSRGRGLFATQDLKMGDIVLCEKAFSVAFASEKERETYVMVNLNTNRGSTGAHATQLFDLVQKLSHNPEQARLYFDLYDGGYTPKIPLQVVDGAIVIDTFRAAAIAEYNRFGCPNVRSSDLAVQGTAAPGKPDEEDDRDSKLRGSVGVWVVASHINHACDGNAVRAFIGDIMIIRAVRDVGAREEVLMRYCNPREDGPATRAHMKETWGFECDCKICEADYGTIAAQLECRKKLSKEAVSFLASNELSTQRQANAASLLKAEKLRTDLEATYNKPTSAKPRLALINLGQWLCQAHNLASSQRKVIDCAIRLLGDLGYGITVTKQKLVIDYARGCPEIAAVDAAMYAARAHYSLGEQKLGGQFEEFAEGFWVVLYAEKRVFGERYGVS
ncbi:hypothetical protein B0A55_05367 [Friedmanniomyces simplex]|uniref:SET domain-containing protein n=1 Tax=Friedmanniomyces simplex TaxID=329884 RepID=A0A4U0XPW2_9PEZI|nr:hypothetical protein B0A55_05367 [Friedmanniomyces simplex]